MTQDEIIEMYLEVSNKLCNGTEWCWAGVGEPLQLFAKLIAQHEREACAKVCEDAPEPDGADLAERIRARGNVATNDTSQERVDKTSESVHEPVAWVSSEELMVMRGNALGGAKDWRINVGLVKQDGDVGLYTTPPQSKPLTDEEIESLYEKTESVNWARSFARAIEAAHGIKGEA